MEDGSTLEEIARVCDVLLLDGGAHPAWLAVPFLHVISAHPTLLSPYKELLEAGCGELSTLPSAADLARHARNLGRGVAAQRIEGLEPTDVVLVAGLVDPAHLSNETDFYFGTLQRSLSERGVRTLLLLRNQTGVPTSQLAPRARRNGVMARALMPSAVRLRDEAAFIYAASRGARAVETTSSAHRADLESRVRRLCRRNLRSPSTTGNLRLESQIESICRTVMPGAVVSMYEGHAWERCVWRGARRANPGIRCVGYQHTIIRKSAHAIRRCVGKLADPDVVMCVGEVTRSDLARAPGLAGTEFWVLGTHRRIVRAKPVAGPGRRRACIVMPEGMIEEAKALFGLAVRAAAAVPDIKFIFRSHPMLPFAQVARAVPALGSLPPNVEISAEPSLERDLDRSGWVLYRGSSTVLYAILAGLKPFYLEQEDELTLDPIYSLDAWREAVRTERELLEAFERDDAADDAVRAVAWGVARDYCDAYALPEQAAAVDRLVDLARAADRSPPS